MPYCGFTRDVISDVAPVYARVKKQPTWVVFDRRLVGVRAVVKRYYDEVMTELDAAALGPLLDALKQERKVDSGVLQLIGEILDIMQSGDLQTKSLEVSAS